MDIHGKDDPGPPSQEVLRYLLGSQIEGKMQILSPERFPSGKEMKPTSPGIHLDGLFSYGTSKIIVVKGLHSGLADLFSHAVSFALPGPKFLFRDLPHISRNVNSQAPRRIDPLPEGKRKKPGRKIHVPHEIHDLYEGKVRSQGNRPIRRPILGLHLFTKILLDHGNAMLTKKLRHPLQGTLFVEIRRVSLDVEGTHVLCQGNPLGIINDTSGRGHPEKTKPIARGQSNISVPLGDLKEEQPSQKGEKKGYHKKSPYVKAEIRLFLAGQPFMGHRTFPP
jgi:hypothetical protein